MTEVKRMKVPPSKKIGTADPSQRSADDVAYGSEDFLSKLLYHYDIVVDHLFPMLDAVEVESLSNLSVAINETFLAKGYWKAFFKQALKVRRIAHFLSVIDENLPTVLGKDNDDDFYENTGSRYARSVVEWRRKFQSNEEIVGKFCSLIELTVGVFGTGAESNNNDGNDCRHNAIDTSRMRFYLRNQDAGRVMSNTKWDFALWGRREDPSLFWEFIVDHDCRHIIGCKTGIEPFRSFQKSGPVYCAIVVWRVVGTELKLNNTFPVHVNGINGYEDFDEPGRRYPDVVTLYSMSDLVFVISRNRRRAICVRIYRFLTGSLLASYDAADPGFGTDGSGDILLVKHGRVITGAGPSVRSFISVWRPIDDDWQRLDRHFDLETKAIDFDLNKRFLVTTETIARVAAPFGERTLLRVWSLQNGSRLYQFDATDTPFFLFNDLVLFPAFEGDYVALKWDFSRSGKEKGDTSESWSVPNMTVLKDFDPHGRAKYTSSETYQVQQNVGHDFYAKFLTVSGSNRDFSIREEHGASGFKIWDYNVMLRRRKRKTATRGNDDDDGVDDASPLMIRLQRSKYPGPAVLRNIGFDGLKIIVCYTDGIEIIPLLDNVS